MTDTSILSGLLQAKEERRASIPHHNVYVSQYKNYKTGEIGYFLPSEEEVASARPMLLRSGHAHVEGVDPLKMRHWWTVGSMQLVHGIECDDLLGPRVLAGGRTYPIHGDAAMMIGESCTYPATLPDEGKHSYDMVTLPQARVGASSLRRMKDMFDISHTLRGQGYNVFVSERTPSLEYLPEEGQLSNATAHKVADNFLPAPERICVLVFGKPDAAHWYELLVLDKRAVMCHEYNYGNYQHLAMRITLAEIIPWFVQPN